jgi:hypothetical protein
MSLTIERVFFNGGCTFCAAAAFYAAELQKKSNASGLAVPVSITLFNFIHGIDARSGFNRWIRNIRIRQLGISSPASGSSQSETVRRREIRHGSGS